MAGTTSGPVLALTGGGAGWTGALPGGAMPGVVATPAGGASADAVSALENLGFKPAVAARAVAAAQGELGEGASEGDLIRRPEIETDVQAALRLTEAPDTAGKSSRRTRRPRKTSKPLPLL